MGGNKAPSADDVKALLKSVGIESDDAQLTKLMADMKDKDIFKCIETGLEKLTSMPSGGSGGAAAGGAAGGAAEEEKKEEEEEEEEEEIAMGGLMGGDDDGGW